MAVNFREQKKKQKYLLGLVGLILLTVAGILYFGFFRKEENEGIIEIAPVSLIKEIKIDYDVLENPFFEKVKPFEKIPDYEGEIGRENPFLPY